MELWLGSSFIQESDLRYRRITYCSSRNSVNQSAEILLQSVWANYQFKQTTECQANRQGGLTTLAHTSIQIPQPFSTHNGFWWVRTLRKQQPTTNKTTTSKYKKKLKKHNRINQQKRSKKQKNKKRNPTTINQ